MPKPINFSVRVQAPPEVVFAVASDIEGSPRVQPAITKVEMLTEGPLRVGTRWRETRRVVGSREATVELEVTDLTPPTTYTVRSASAGTTYDARFDVRAGPGGPGTTDLALTLRATPGSLGARVMGWVAAPMMRRALLDDLRTIAREAERRTPGG